jgi:hypothetical protein
MAQLHQRSHPILPTTHHVLVAPHGLKQTPTPQPAIGTIHQNMNHVTYPTTHLVPPPHPYLSHRNGRRTATIRAHGPTPCVLPSADPYSPPTTSDPIHSQIQDVEPPAPPFLIIPGTPDPESPISTTPSRDPDYAPVVRLQPQRGREAALLLLRYSRAAWQGVGACR